MHGNLSLNDDAPIGAVARQSTDEYDDVCIVVGGQDGVAIAQQLHTRLSSGQCRVWPDAPDNWDARGHACVPSKATIAASRSIIFLIPSHLECSIEFNAALYCALDYGKWIVPLVVQESEGDRTIESMVGQVSDALSHQGNASNGNNQSDVSQVESRLRLLKWIPIRDDAEQVTTISDQIQSILKAQHQYIEYHITYLNQALRWYQKDKRASLLLDAPQCETARQWLTKKGDATTAHGVPSDYHAEFITESVKQAQHGMTQVFVSYSEDDRLIKQRLHRRLIRDGITLWSSDIDIKTGEDFQEAINRGIEQADALIFLMSPHSIRSAFCQHELRHAQLYNKRVIPLFISNPQETEIPVDLQTLQFVDFHHHDSEEMFERNVRELLRILDEDVDYYHIHKILLNKALQWDRLERRKEFLLRGNAFVDAENWLSVSRQTNKQPPPTSLHVSFIEASREVNRYFDAFVSYGRADSLDFAIKLDSDLSQQGLNVWFDKVDIPLGVDFQEQINDGIARSHNFIFIISPHSVNSSYCKREIELAIRFRKRIVPLLHVETIAYNVWQERNPQGTLEDWQAYQDQGLSSIFPNMDPVISKINWVPFREGMDDYRHALDRLVELFSRHLVYVEQHTIYLMQALVWEKQQRKTECLLVGDDRLEAEQWLKTQFFNEQPPCRPTELHAEFICESIKNAANLMTQVFISHAEVDHHVREKVRYSLMFRGITTWINRTDIKTGVDFQEEINRGIEETDNVVWLMSPASLASAYCREELEYALYLKKRIIPLLIHDIDIEDVPMGLRSLQFIDCRNYEQPDAYHQSIGKLIKSLDEDARYHHQHKLLLVKALRWKQQKYNPSILLRGVELRHFRSWFRAANQHPQYRPIPLQEEFIAESENQPADTTLNVFIAYSRSDGDFARKLNQTLQIQGMTTWFDQENIQSGEDFKTEIFQGIENSENFLFIISPSSVVSSFCNEEVDYAKRLNKRIVTVLYREVSVALLPSALMDLQWIDFRRHGGDFLSNFGELLRTLASNPAHVRMHTRLLVRSREWDEADRDDSYLMRGRDLEQAIAWAETAETLEPRPTPLQHAYIDASEALPKRRVRPRMVVFSSLAATVVVAIARTFGMTEGLELLAYDHLLRLRPNESQDQRMTLVTVDSQSSRDLRNRMIDGQFDDYERGYGTIPDGALANVLATLQQHQPRLVALDFYRDFEADPQLAQQMRDMDNLIAACKHAATDDRGNLVEGYTPPPEIDMQQIGSTDFVDDGGKFIRRNYLYQAPDPDYCNTRETLSLVIAKHYLESEGYTFTSPLNEDGVYIRDGLTFGDTSIPVLWGNGSGFRDRNNRLNGYQTLLNFRVHEGQIERFVETIPLADVLDGSVSPDRVRDRIILIGYTDRADINTDYWDTPYGLVSGVHLQGQQASQLIHHVLENRALIWWWPIWGEYVWVFAWATLTGVALWWFYQPKWLITAGVGTVLILYIACYSVMATQVGWLPLVPAIIAMGGTGALVVMCNHRVRSP
jgi:CHASE2 domain-containing sensor protein